MLVVYGTHSINVEADYKWQMHIKVALNFFMIRSFRNLF